MPGITQTVIRAPESTENIPATRRVRDVSDRLAYLDPDSAPLTVITMRGKSRVAINTKFEWGDKELPARWDAINGGLLAAGDTTLTVDNAKFFSVGDIVNVVRTGEKFRVATVTTPGTITVVRGVGSTSAAALLDNDDLQIIGNAYQEGDLSGPVKSHTENMLFNYLQIVRTPLGATRSEENSENYFQAGKRVGLRREKAIEHKIDLERTALFGERNIDVASTDNPRRYTGGIFFFLTGLSTTAVIKDFGGLVTEAEMEDFMQSVFQPTGSGDTRTFIASPLWISILDQIAAGRMQVVDRAETYGVTVRQWITAHGSFQIVKHRLLENSPVPAGTVGGPFGYAGYGLALDLGQLTYRFLANSNTSLHEDIHARDYDGWKDEYLTEMGWQIELAKVHGVAKGATG
jgi:Family of unknown function (DUF5309)